MSQIFISYSRRDKDFVDRLARDIEAVEFDVWTDRADITGGEDWYRAISRAIRKCSSFLLVLSPNSSGSEKVAQELSLADKYGRHIVPLMCESCEVSEDLELPLARRQTIDFTGDYDEALRRLLASLAGRSQQEQQQPKRPAPEEGRRPESEPPAGGSPPVQAGPEPVDNFVARPPERAPQLGEVLPGRWDVTVIYPMRPPINASLSLAPDGSFWIQLPMGSRAQGGWSVNQGNQVYMQGMETNGMMTAPYAAWLTVMNFTRDQLNGVGAHGERVIWRRAG